MNTLSQSEDRGQSERHVQRLEPSTQQEPDFDVYVVLDFEATCERHQRLEVMEVIEFPMVLVDARNGNVIGEFHEFVRPVVNPQLSSFCTELTGILQSTVDGARTFPDVFTSAVTYLQQHGCGEAPPFSRYLVVTFGDWDLKTMLPNQVKTCANLGINLLIPPSFRRWFNIKQHMRQVSAPVLRSVASRRIRDLPDMLSVLGLEMKGRHHSGIDDCRNIVAALRELIKLGYIIAPTTDNSNSMARYTQRMRCCSSAPVDSNGAWSNNLQMDQHEGTNVNGNTVEGGNHVDNNPSKQNIGKRVHINVLEGKDPLHDLLGLECDNSKHVTSSLPKQRAIAYSKALSRILRHGADDMGITISDVGYVLIDDLLRCKPFACDREACVHLAWVVHSNDKKRFKMVYGEDKRIYIRANQGHSLPGIDPDLTRIASAVQVPFAVHGTYYVAWEKISRCGYLSTMGRQHIHFAKGMPGSDGVVSGMRAAAEVLLILNVPLLLEHSVELWESSNGVLLTPGVGETKRLPLIYIKSVIDRRTGVLLPLFASGATGQ